MAVFDINKQALLAIAVALAVSGPACAEMRTTGYYGNWTTMAGTNSTGHPMCLAGILGNPERLLMLKYQSDAPGRLFVHLFKNGWYIIDGQPIDVVVQIDNAPRMRFHGHGLPPTDQWRAGIELTMDLNERFVGAVEEVLPSFLNELAEGVQLKVFFGGNEGGWVGSLAGSNAALQKMRECLDRMDPTPSQPYSRQPYSAQPFGNPTQPSPFTNPTQPYYRPL